MFASHGSNLEKESDLSDWLESAYSYLAMVNYPYPAEFLKPLPGNPVKEVSCLKMHTKDVFTPFS